MAGAAEREAAPADVDRGFGRVEPNLMAAEGSDGRAAKPRQAVVVIHGIGEQRPMDTLRSFVEAVLGIDPAAEADSDRPPAYYNKPDRLSDGFELRRLSTRESRPRTEFFELYWAHRMPTATWGRVVDWLRLLLWRPYTDVPTQFRGLWWASWATVAVLALALLASLALLLAPSLGPSSWPAAAALALPFGLGGLPLLLLQYVVLGYIGDAAVYLSANPRNVEARNAIRGAGVALLRRLHEAGEYCRVVVVGHSLGSVIGYDVLTHAWQLYNECHGRPEAPRHDALPASERAARALREAGSPPGGAAREAWERATRRLWVEQRGTGCPWLVTDFVTLGSPLTHADLLLASSRADFRRKVRERELPVCPPEPEGKGVFSFEINYQAASGARRTVRVLHHAALFAVARWTNLYFPASRVLHGDPIGGPVARLFGPGVRDVAVQTATWRGWLAHTHYWRRCPKDAGMMDNPLDRLREALDLGRKGFRDEAPPHDRKETDAADDVCSPARREA